MSKTQSKRTGLGAESYFQNIPTLDDPSAAEPADQGTRSPTDRRANGHDEDTSRKKVRRTYALYEETQIALEEMKLDARKRGESVTLGDLLEEAVQLLIHKKQQEKAAYQSATK